MSAVAVRTNIVIDSRLMQGAMKAAGLKTKKETVELGLKTILRLSEQAKIRQFRGKLAWDADLDAMRTDR